MEGERKWEREIDGYIERWRRGERDGLERERVEGVGREREWEGDR
jgi:hypothetical protein